MSKFSEAYEEAVRSRATNSGLVAYSILTRLTPDEWALIRLMSQSQARRIITKLEMPPPIAESRTKTPTIDAKVLENLVLASDHSRMPQ